MERACQGGVLSGRQSTAITGKCACGEGNNRIDKHNVAKENQS